MIAGEVRFDVPGPPVAKGRPRATTIAGRARMYTPKKTAGAEALIAMAGHAAMGGREPFCTPLSMVVEVRLPVPASWSKKRRAAALQQLVRPTGRPDLDNFVKTVCDGCNGIVYADDSYVVEMTVRKVYGAWPGTNVHVYGVSGECAR